MKAKTRKKGVSVRACEIFAQFGAFYLTESKNWVIIYHSYP